MRSQRTPAFPLLALFAAAVVVAAAAVVTRVTEPTGQVVAVVGDSITVLSANQIDLALARQHPTVEARMGATVGDMVPYAEPLAASRPRQVVIDLGTNDALHGTPIAQTSDDLSRMVALFPAAECIHLVRVNTHMHPEDGGVIAQRARAVNEVIDRFVASDGRIDTVDWDSIVARSIDASGGSPLISPDTVHPTPAGSDVLARAIGSAVSGCGRPWKFW